LEQKKTTNEQAVQRSAVIQAEIN